MADYSLVPVEHPPDFEDVSLVPVPYNPFSDDGVTQSAQSQQAQDQPAQPRPQQTATGRIYVGPLAKNTQASEPTPTIASGPQPLATQAGNDGISQASPPSEPTPDVVTPQQMLQGTISQFYPGAQFMDLAQQAYKNGQYGNAIGYGVGALADSVFAAAGGKLLGAGIAAGANALRWSSRVLARALERAGHVRQEGEFAHHIAAKLAKRAKPARVKMQRLGIDINDPANGIFLHRDKHSTLHNNQYYDAVNKALESATSKAEGIQVLQSIGRGLKSDTFP